MSKVKGTDLAPDGQVWVCGACGKRSRTRYGFVSRTPTPDNPYTWTNFLPDGSRVSAGGYDESCMMHAVLCYDTEPLKAVDPQPE